MSESQDLQEFIDGKQKFLKLADKEEFIGYFMGYKIIPDKFKIAEDPQAKTVVYQFKTERGKDVEFTTGNISAAKGLIPLKPGQGFKITRRGMAAKTTYDVIVSTQVFEEKVPF
jgi:hypothetical protein